MTRQLVDVNVLLALLWPRHVHHRAAHAWFADSGHLAWATNSLVQLGVLRLLTNPAVTQDAVSPARALSTLSAATSHPGHQFWPLQPDITRLLDPVAQMVRGFRQWTDAALLMHAVEQGGVLVTFDAGLKTLTEPPGSSAGTSLKILRAH